MVQKSFNKVFCIGMNKTGTSSLHQAFLALGLNSIHHGLPNCTTLKEHIDSAKVIRENVAKV
jgi:Sulfotransferase domain